MENKLIKFHETELIAVVDDNGKVGIAIKPICNAIGLHADSAVRSIKNHPILGPAHAVQHVQIGQNQKREYVTLPIEHVHGWLFSIDLSKVNPEPREKLLIFQRECYQVLYDHFYGKSRQMMFDKERRRYELSEELRDIDSHTSKLSKRRKVINKEISELDLEMYRQLELVPAEG